MPAAERTDPPPAAGRIRLLLKGDPSQLRPPEVDVTAGRRGCHGRIRCPRCAWEPGPGDRWMCVCLHAWNTFETGGVCPACDHRWTKTQCLRCAEWSRHEDWYEEPQETS